MKYNEVVQYVVSNYNGPKVSIIGAGPCTWLAALQRIPGSSRIMNGIYLPYSESSLFGFLKYPVDLKSTIKIVSEQTAKDMARAAFMMEPRQSIGIGVTGAVTTHRQRQGDNHAFVAIYDGVEYRTTHLQLVKLTEEQHKTIEAMSSNDAIKHFTYIRNGEDEAVSQAVLAMLMKDAKLGNHITKHLFNNLS